MSSQFDWELQVDWDVCATSLLLPLLIVPLSMVAFIVRRGRKQKSYRQAFYAFFIAVTVTDCTVVLVERLNAYVFILWQLAKFETAAWRILDVSNTALMHVTYVTANFQPMCHTVMAFNRFTALAFLFKHSRIWKRRTARILLILIAAASVLLTALPSIIFGIIWAGLSPEEFEHWFSFGASIWDIDWNSVSNVLCALNLVLCCVVSFVVNIGTVAFFVRRRRSTSMQEMPKEQDVRLFLHSLFMFLVQLWLTLQRFVIATDQFRDALMAGGSPAPPWIPKWLVLSSRDWLAGDALCEVEPQMVLPEYGANYCGTLYAIFTGYGRVSETLWVAGITKHVFALSSAPLLLVLSGNVRNDYFQFYFGFLMRRKVHVVQVTPVQSLVRQFNHV